MKAKTFDSQQQWQGHGKEEEGESWCGEIHNVCIMLHNPFQGKITNSILSCQTSLHKIPLNYKILAESKFHSFFSSNNLESSLLGVSFLFVGG
jgi:hypothetical protein